MGYEKERFVDEVDEELLCAICGLVLKDPVQIRQCEHCFCSDCMYEWWKHRQTCPIDRTRVPSVDDIISPPRIVRNMLSRLKLTCDNVSFWLYGDCPVRGFAVTSKSVCTQSKANGPCVRRGVA